jgi:hypothetical protein
MTFAGVIAFPNWRFIAQNMIRSSGFRGDSIGWMRMMISFRVRRAVCMAPAVMCERERREQRAERDAEPDADGIVHDVALERLAAHVSATMMTAGTYTPGASMAQCDAGSRPAIVSVTCTSACRT